LRLTRRSALAGAVAFAAPAVLAQTPDVIVVGAGIAGLAAADRLTRSGARVQVIEARERIGGRLWTRADAAGLPIDLGGAWVHGTRGNPLTDLADRAGVELIATDPDSAVTLGAGADRVEAAWDLAEDLAEAATEAAGPGQSLGSALTALPAWARLTAADRQAMQEGPLAALAAEYGAEAELLDARTFDDDDPFPGPDGLPRGGYSALLAALSAGPALRLRTPVTGLAPVAGGVSVTTAMGEDLRAGAVIVTLPLGVLQSGAVRIAGGWPGRTARAIAALGMGVLNKTVLRFPAVFWPDEVDWITLSGAGERSQWFSLARALDAPVLIGFLAGTAARAAEARAQEVAEAMAALTRVFGPSVPDPVGVMTTAWASDPWALGAYSCHASGSGPADRAALAEPIWDGRLLLAGEATHPRFWGNAHGAYQAGLEAAARLGA
jgi:monoamine oxidase